jgi:hypothetical protein
LLPALDGISISMKAADVGGGANGMPKSCKNVKTSKNVTKSRSRAGKSFAFATLKRALPGPPAYWPVPRRAV